jgi:hypothetical protein
VGFASWLSLAREGLAGLLEAAARMWLRRSRSQKQWPVHVPDSGIE